MEDHHATTSNTLELSDGFWRGRIPFFGKNIDLHIESESSKGPTCQQKKGVEIIINFCRSDLDSIRKWALDYLTRREELINFEKEGIFINRLKIEEHFVINSAFIPRLGGAPSAIFMLDGECDWDEELGFQLVYFDSTIIYCGEIVAPSMSTTNWDAMLKSTRQLDDLRALLP